MTIPNDHLTPVQLSESCYCVPVKILQKLYTVCKTWETFERYTYIYIIITVIIIITIIVIIIIIIIAPPCQIVQLPCGLELHV